MQHTVNVKLEMTISRADFLRTLPAVMKGLTYTESGGEIVSESASGSLRIRLSEEGQRNLGPIPLPVIHVELCFNGFGDDDRRRFLERFDSCYRRGGG